MAELNELTAGEAAARIRRREISSERLVTDCLLRIEAREPDVQAWEYLDPEYALEQARARDREDPSGPLHGVPVAVKDLIDTFDMPTSYGSPIYEGHRPPWDAAGVALAREAGAVVLGKTVTSEFAGFHQGKTRNPHDPGRMPGFSSMGSAAAVADRHVPLAFGSQTGGSIIKPASFCGCVGYMPSFNAFPLQGIHPLAWSTDHLGHFARSVDDIALFGGVLAARPDFGRADVAGPPRIGLCRMPPWESAPAEVRDAVERAADAAGRAGATVREVALPKACEPISELLGVILPYEAARIFAHVYRAKRDMLSEVMRGLIETGRRMDVAEYRAALRAMAAGRAALAGLFEDVDVLLVPSAEFEAPAIGQPVGASPFVRLWTLLHVPALNLPYARGPAGLPIGVQLVGPQDEDDRFLAHAAWIERAVMPA